ncbi:MAG: pseudouridine synthase [Allosphingosinicella sp.]
MLARAGIASRREVERMIAEGRIAIDGKILDTPATLLESLHGVTVDGQPVKAATPARLFRYHKPAGLLTTERDPKGRPTIYDWLPKDLPRLMPVGRLDWNTEGLLLLTTDGGLKRQLELPATGVERTYRARAFGDVSQDQLEGLIEGVEIEGVRYGPIDANLERRTGRNQWIEMRLREGKNREVRIVLEHLGLQVSRLIRTSYGPFVLGDLAPGAVDEVRQHDLVAFRKDPTGASLPPAPAGAGERGGTASRQPGRPRPAPAPTAAKSGGGAFRKPRNHVPRSGEGARQPHAGPPGAGGPARKPRDAPPRTRDSQRKPHDGTPGARGRTRDTQFDAGGPARKPYDTPPRSKDGQRKPHDGAPGARGRTRDTPPGGGGPSRKPHAAPRGAKGPARASPDAPQRTKGPFAGPQNASPPSRGAAGKPRGASPGSKRPPSPRNRGPDKRR